MRILRAMLLLAVLLPGLAGQAAAYAERGGSFVAERACPAPASIRRDSNPGDIRVEPGRRYVVRALNKPGGAHVHVEIAGARPPLRWVALDCGRLEPEDGTAAAEPAGTAPSLLPFFGTDGSLPAPPALGPLDRAVLALCGGWGSRPDAKAFRRMLDDPALAPEVEQIRAALDGRVTGPHRGPDEFRDELTRAWFRSGGFRHVFCGEPGPQGLGGLHYAGRYLQMQEEGWGGLDPTCRRTERVPPVQTFGVRYRIPGGGWGRACPKGYAEGLDAAALMVEAVRAYRALQPPADGTLACLHPVAEPGYLAVFVARDGAIRTFYPDASPSCDSGGPPQGCLCGE